MNVRIDRHRGHPQREAQDYGRRLGTDSGQALEPRLRLFHLHFAQEGQIERAELVPDHVQHLFDAGRLLLCESARSDSLFDLFLRSVRDRVQILKTAHQTAEGPS